MRYPARGGLPPFLPTPFRPRLLHRPERRPPVAPGPGRARCPASPCGHDWSSGARSSVDRPAAAVAFAAAFAQEAFDLRDQLSAGRQSRLVDHALQALDVRPRLFVERSRRIETRAQLLRLTRQQAKWDLHTEVA